MFGFAKKKKWFQKLMITIPLGVFLLILIARIYLPYVVLENENQKGANSENYEVHSEKMELSVLRGIRRYQNIKVFTKPDHQELLSAKEVEFSLSWGELIGGRVVLDITMVGVHFNLTQEVLKYVGKHPGDKRYKFNDVEVVDGTIILKDFENYKITEIHGRLTNLTALTENPISQFDFKGRLTPSSELKLKGSYAPLDKPLAWNIDAEVEKFDLTKINLVLGKRVPLEFKKGTLDLYVEAHSRKGKVEGYAKPFFNQAEITGENKKYDGPDSALITFLGKVGNIFLENEKTGSIATRVPFTFDKELKIDSGVALKKALENSDKKLPRGIEGAYEL